jgi:hypothetical protein
MDGRVKFQLWRQHHEDLMREAETRRLAKALRKGGERLPRRIPALAWELRRHGGRVPKFLRRACAERRDRKG